MSDRFYVVIFDQLDPSFNPSAIRDAIREDARISHYWNHIPNCFPVTNAWTVETLTTWMKKQTGDVGFLVIEADPRNSEGYLPDRSWDWIRTREQERSSEPV